MELLSYCFDIIRTARTVAQIIASQLDVSKWRDRTTKVGVNLSDGFIQPS